MTMDEWWAANPAWADFVTSRREELSMRKYNGEVLSDVEHYQWELVGRILEQYPTKPTELPEDVVQACAEIRKILGKQ